MQSNDCCEHISALARCQLRQHQTLNQLKYCSIFRVTVVQSPILGWRNMRTVGYQGFESRSNIQPNPGKKLVLLRSVLSSVTCGDEISGERENERDGKGTNDKKPNYYIHCRSMMKYTTQMGHSARSVQVARRTEACQGKRSYLCVCV